MTQQLGKENYLRESTQMIICGDLSWTCAYSRQVGEKSMSFTAVSLIGAFGGYKTVQGYQEIRIAQRTMRIWKMTAFSGVGNMRD